MKFLKSKFLIICLAVVLSIALITGILATVGFSGPIKLVLGTVSKPFSLLGSAAADAFNGFVSVFTDYDELKAENDALKAELEAIKDEKYNSEVLKNENEWLKGYLDLATQNPKFKFADARVVGRQSDNYSTVITLDKGAVHGIKVDMPVVTEDGVFGHVAEVGLDWCRVVSIIETASAVGAYVDRTGAGGIVSGDADLRDGGNCVLTRVDSVGVQKGDKIYTSGGSGSIYPSGLLIGTATELYADEATRTLSATVTPAVDFLEIDKIERIMIITGYGR